MERLGFSSPVSDKGKEVASSDTDFTPVRIFEIVRKAFRPREDSSEIDGNSSRTRRIGETVRSQAAKTSPSIAARDPGTPQAIKSSA